jgi:hypothetical protein
VSAIFELPLQSETLSPEEIVDISGCARKADQVDWLKSNNWVFVQNRAGLPIVGRLYARMRLAGINPATLAANSGGSSWQIDTSKVR